MQRTFRQVDVFTAEPYRGNPLAVVVDADGLSTDDMQQMANWTNLSETTFLLKPTTDEADYRVRIFTPMNELPFAGHPTLGSCRVWLDTGGKPSDPGCIVQECDAGLVPIRPSVDGEPDGGSLAFRAPPLMRSGPVDDMTVDRMVAMLGIDHAQVIDSAWIDNGPGWAGLLLGSADEVLAIEPGIVDMEIGVIGPHPDGAECRFELRAFFGKDGATVEDPVTGSLNASAAMWLVGSGRAEPPYTAAQGTAIGRRGRISVSADHDGAVWIGGRVQTIVIGTVEA